MKKLHLIGNAHIDPVWLWRWQDGYSEVLASWRSALDRMKEYDDFTYTSACAVYYQWVEKTDPEMFAEIPVFNSMFFTVDGDVLESYKADVHSDAAYAKDTEVVKLVNADGIEVYAFQESTFRSAPYFDIIIDGIKVPASN